MAAAYDGGEIAGAPGTETRAGSGNESSPDDGCSIADILAVHELLAREAHLLDDRDYAAWLRLFTEDCLYWMPVDPLSDDGKLRLNIIYDDRPRLQDRVARLISGAAHSENPATLTAHMLSVIQIAPDNRWARLTVRSNFTVAAYRNGQQRILTGRYLHRLVRKDRKLLIAEKRVGLLGSDSPMQPMAFPV